MNKATPERLIRQAEKWIGYCEKKSNKDLDNFTANAGKNNYTKFNNDYVTLMKGHAYPGAKNMQWCNAWVSMMLVYEFGFENACKMMGGDLSCYTPYSAKLMKKIGKYRPRKGGNPKAGDIIWFYSASKKRIGHIGIVYKVDKSKVYTIEGNTSGGSKLVTNGGAVWRKSYALSSTYIDGYATPLYDAVDLGDDFGGIDNDNIHALGERTLKKGLMGEDVKELQEILSGWNYDLGACGVDGDFGSKTRSAVISFQRSCGLEDDGIYGAKTHEALMKKLALETETGDEIWEEEPVEDVSIPDDEEALEDEPEATGDEDPAVDFDRVVRVFGNTVNVRTQPNTSGAIVYVAKKGEELAYTGMTSEDGWHCVVVEGVASWISGKYSEVEYVDDPDEWQAPVEIADDDRMILDISHYQTVKDASQVAKCVKHIIHRGSVGVNRDTKFDKHVKALIEAGIPCACYHYNKAKTVKEAREEARLLWSVASKYPMTCYYADMEYSGIPNGKAREICSAFLDELRKLGAKKVGIYVGGHLVKKWNLNLEEADIVWIPRYGDKKTNQAGKPGKKPAHKCDLWQYTSYVYVDGIKGRCDGNVLTGDGAEFVDLIS